jgi:hypothetical protein
MIISVIYTILSCLLGFLDVHIIYDVRIIKYL